MPRYENLPPVNGAAKPKTYRQSLLQLADNCPRSAYLSLVHDGGPSTAPLNRGRVGHETIERALRTCVEQGEDRIDQYTLKVILDEVVRDHPEWPVPVADMDVLREMLFHFAEHFTVPPNPLIEAPFRLDVNGRDVTGRIDLAWVDGDTAFVRDWKFGFSLPAQDDVSGKDPNTGEQRGVRAFQLIVYALLLADGETDEWELPAGVNQFDLAFVYPLYVGDYGLVERRVVMSRPELIEHRAWLAGLVARMEQGFQGGNWPAMPGSHCSRCPSPTECPIPAHLRGQGRATPFERDPSELAEEVFFMVNDASRLKDELRLYCEQYGSIAVGSDRELGFAKSSSRRLSKRGKQLLEEGKSVPAGEYTEAVSTRFDFRRRNGGA